MFVLPGDSVGAAEEYLPSFGVYSDDDGLYSASTGELELDAGSHVAKVNCRTKIPKLQNVGTVTLGVVAEATDNRAIVDLAAFDSRSFKFVPQGTSAILKVSSIKRGYVKSLKDEIKIGDIVRVKIIDVSPHSVHLTTDGKNLGVVKAFCTRCRHHLDMKGARLQCPQCGSLESRKTADDYGKGRII